MAIVLSSIKMINAVRRFQPNSIQFRREKMTKKIDEQIKLATALRDGITYSVKRLRNITDTTSGEVTQIEISKRINQWFWTENSKTLFQLKYGIRVLVLSGKDKNTIEVASNDDLIKTLESVNEAVLGGELDAQIESAANVVKSRFEK
jgi:hypothetical protein